jgi:hypothetical protein
MNKETLINDSELENCDAYQIRLAIVKLADAYEEKVNSNLTLLAGSIWLGQGRTDIDSFVKRIQEEAFSMMEKHDSKISGGFSASNTLDKIHREVAFRWANNAESATEILLNIAADKVEEMRRSSTALNSDPAS